GVVISSQTRLGKVSISRPKRDDRGRLVKNSAGNTVWNDEDDIVQGIVLMRKNERMLPAVQNIKAKMNELNANPGRLLPGVQLVAHWDVSGLIQATTETVRENLYL